MKTVYDMKNNLPLTAKKEARLLLGKCNLKSYRNLTIIYFYFLNPLKREELSPRSCLTESRDHGGIYFGWVTS